MLSFLCLYQAAPPCGRREAEMSKKDFVYFADVTISDFVIMIIYTFISFSFLPLQINILLCWKQRKQR